MKHNVTVYDIAKEAEVSVSTVSRVLNGTAPVKESTREKIMALINKYQFQPNALARSLTKKETKMIGVILPDITNPFFPEVFWGVENEANSKGYTFFLCNTSGQPELESQSLTILREKQVDGIIFMGGRINLSNCSQELAKEVEDIAKKIPIVLVNGNLPSSSLHRVIINEGKGAEMLTQHLIDLGHNEIAFFGGYDYVSTTTQKVKAFKKMMKANGFKVPNEWVLYGDFTMDAGKKMMAEILKREKRPTAIFCVNDVTAVGAVKVAVEAGLKIPEDMAIVGFDDTILASTVIPELTTVSQKSLELGKNAVNVLHKLINNEKVKKLTVIEPELVIRNSTLPKSR
ncbi:LacI family transcriptional regulator [Bacillus sp. sid0103]|uniref:LacI family DNA-binding transcriptional regulator n=1 Tax=Bacillus sp. sid0103 TaxID=2856337 RepID=UPI001C48960D|nr:LacI family DNA-binding transcriptional regulator [Bacillus sp. sid0103]MBV7505301.1 LacI family transcriptional regulator [Bacillus sp. sid0103]